MNSGNSRVRLEPDLRYMGPEVTVGGLDPPGIRYMQPATDIFSLGVLFYELYKYNLKLVQERRPHLCTMPLSGNSCMDHPNALDSISSIDMNFLPHELSNLLQVSPSLRALTLSLSSSCSVLSVLSTRLTPAPPLLFSGSL